MWSQKYWWYTGRLGNWKSWNYERLSLELTKTASFPPQYLMLMQCQQQWLILENVQNYSVYLSQNTQETINIINRKDECILEHLKDEESDLIQQFCLDFSDIFSLGVKQLTFTNKIKQSIDTNNVKPVHTKSSVTHKEEVKEEDS